MALRFANAAIADLQLVYSDGLARYGAAQANAYLGRLRAALDFIERFPVAV
jgi:plasmid stabilization system protein ParE